MTDIAKLKQFEDNAGDGTVSLQGAMLSGAQIRFCGQPHMTLIAADEVKSVVRDLFDADSILPAGQRNLAVRDKIVGITQPVHASLQDRNGSAVFDGKIVWERADPVDPQSVNRQDPVFTETSVPMPKGLRYTGPETEAITLRLSAPEVPGIYRLVFKSARGGNIVSDAFVVRTEPI